MIFDPVGAVRIAQLQADVTGRTETVCEADEAGCLGAAILARAARSGTPASELAAEMVTLGRTEIVFVDEIPQTSVGKFDKKTLRSQYESFYGEE